MADGDFEVDTGQDDFVAEGLGETADLDRCVWSCRKRPALTQGQGQARRANSLARARPLVRHLPVLQMFARGANEQTGVMPARIATV